MFGNEIGEQSVNIQGDIDDRKSEYKFTPFRLASKQKTSAQSSEQENKRESEKARKQTNKQANKQTSRQASNL
jgi:hypothetical protein